MSDLIRAATLLAVAAMFAVARGPGVKASPPATGALVFDNPGLEAANSDGTGLRCLASDAEYPVWSPDGSAILFGTEDGLLETLSVANGTLTTLSRNTAVGAPEYSWSPDGKRIVYTLVRPSPGGFDLVVANADGTNRHVVARGSGIREPSEPAWAPERGLIAFTDFEKAPPSRSDPTRSAWDSLFVVQPDGRGRRRLARNIDGTKSLVWSPNGKRIAFVRSGQIWVVRADGKSEHRVGPTLDYFTASNPDWSPDGKMLAVEGEAASGSDDQEELYVLRPAALHPTLVARGPSNLNAPNNDLDWVAWSPSGSTIATEFNGAIVLVDPNGATVRTIVDHGGNARWDPRSRTTDAYRGSTNARCVTTP